MQDNLKEEEQKLIIKAVRSMGVLNIKVPAFSVSHLSRISLVAEKKRKNHLNFVILFLKHSEIKSIAEKQLFGLSAITDKPHELFIIDEIFHVVYICPHIKLIKCILL